MKRLYPLLSVLFLIYWGCEEEQDTTPPTVTITFSQNNSSVFEIVSITCISSDNEGVEKVELWVNGVTTDLTDNSEPYSFDWNTTLVDNGNYTITIRSYDTSENTTDSEPVVLTVDNTLSVPQGGNVTSVIYTITEMTVEWEESSDGDFKDYKVLYSDTESGDKDTLETYTDKSTTSYTITEFDPLIENWFWVQVTDTLGFSSIGTGMTNGIDSPPSISELYGVHYENGTHTISWSQNNDSDFSSYKLYESLSEDMSNKTLIFETGESIDTAFFKSIETTMYYQIVVEDYWGLQITSDIEFGDIFVILWGETYSASNTTELYFWNFGLTGEIPTEIGYLTNLTSILLIGNQLAGEIPSEIGNLTNLDTLILIDNELTGEMPPEIGLLTNLTNLNLRNNELTGSIPPEIGNLTNLTTLNLKNNWFTGEIPSEIGYLTNLTYLGLYMHQVTWSIPPEIGNLTNLDKLDLGGNQLTGSIPPEIGNLTNLTRLYLYNSQLTGEVPSEIGNLTNLSELRLYSNHLTGSIPHEIGNLTNLTYLILSGNQLTGEIPSEIGNLTNLTALNLNDNQLTGIIPDEICNQGDSSPSLYNNQLCPPYPSCVEDYVGNQDTSGCD
ncbi:leucine-rich repeat domain-containing protein [Candidatus Marinimicrobia bacterium]|nr:leucine-rich repeat domain-containing protein [Candidatus Neomarinimicrobiota bacterium]